MKKIVNAFMLIAVIVIFSSCTKREVSCVIRNVEFVRGHTTITYIPVFIGKSSMIIPQTIYVSDKWKFVADCDGNLVKNASENEVYPGDTILLKVNYRLVKD